MSRRVGVSSRLFTALANAGVNVRIIDQGASEISIIVGVDAADLGKGLRAIYDAFVRT
jgi:aspartate kinase